MTKIIKSLLAVLLLVTLTGCTKATEKPNDPAPVSPPAANNVPEPEPDKSDNKTIRTDVKKAIDAYEDFIDEYIVFMKKYESSDNTLAMMKDYLNYISKLAEFEEKMGALEEDLNDAEELYFIEVMNRCNLKMLESLQ